MMKQFNERRLLIHQELNRIPQFKSELPEEVTLVAVSKTKPNEDLQEAYDAGQRIFGENKIQEMTDKWEALPKDIQWHMIGHVQTNKVKFAVKIFDYIHSLDNEKLAKKIAEEQIKQNLKPKIFIQVNLGNESQKSGILKENLLDFYNFSKNLDLNIIGIMCIPPFNEDSTKYFSQMSELNELINLKELSMGMSSDYLNAIEHKSTYLRIGSNIFGQRG